MMITIARQVGVGLRPSRTGNFLSAQSLLGIGPGIAISRQQHLAMNLERYRHRLENELQARRALAEKLIHSEEDTRKLLARASFMMRLARTSPLSRFSLQLVKRTSDTPLAIEAAGQINDLARGVSATTPHASFCASLPPVLEELLAHEALHHLGSTSSPLLNADPLPL